MGAICYFSYATLATTYSHSDPNANCSLVLCAQYDSNGLVSYRPTNSYCASDNCTPASPDTNDLHGALLSIHYRYVDYSLPNRDCAIHRYSVNNLYFVSC